MLSYLNFFNFFNFLNFFNFFNSSSYSLMFLIYGNTFSSPKPKNFWAFL